MEKKEIYDLAEKIIISALSSAQNLSSLTDDDLKEVVNEGMDQCVRVATNILEYKKNYLQD